MKFRIPALLLLTATALASTGCAFLGSRHHQEGNSIVQFLYPGKDQPFIQPSIPTLHVPLRVGLAFVPPGRPAYQTAFTTEMISEAQKSQLLDSVAARFRRLPFVQSIEVLPETYLRPGGGFENLDQLRSLLGVDVVVLVAYDQAQITSDTPWSLAYWTIVGAYVVPTQKNDTHTLLEAVVYDIPSRSLLFRAPGTSLLQDHHATLAATEEQMRQDSARGFQEASVQLSANLERELAAFRVRIHDQPETVHVERRAGYSGGGAFNAGEAGVIAALLLLSLLVQIRTSRAPSHDLKT